MVRAKIMEEMVPKEALEFGGDINIACNN